MELNPLSWFSEGAKAVGGVVDSIGNAIDKNVTSEEEKLILRKQLEDLKLTFLMEELKQGDKYTKRARPTVVYVGLIIAFLEMFGFRLMFLTWAGVDKSVIEAANLMLNTFWLAWGGVVGGYALGRSYEKVKSVFK